NARMNPIAQIAVYVARGIVRNGRLASSPNNAVASNPMKPVAANNNPIANDPDPNTEWTLNASIRNPVRNSTAKSNTNKTSTSSTSATPSTRALKSTPERAKRKHTSNDNRPHRYQCMVKPVMSAITVCRKKPLVPIVPTTKKLYPMVAMNPATSPPVRPSPRTTKA